MAHEFGIMSHYDIQRTAEAFSGERDRLAIGPTGVLASIRGLFDGYVHTSVISGADCTGDLTKPLPRVALEQGHRYSFFKKQIASALRAWQLRRPLR